MIKNILLILGGGILLYIIIRFLLLKTHNYIDNIGLTREDKQERKPFKFSTDPVTKR